MNRLFNWIKKLSKKKNKADEVVLEGPINQLPNEIIQLIVAKLGLDSDVKKLIQLRLVSSRWKAIVEDYCLLKKCLIVHLDTRTVPYDYTSYFEETFFGFVNLTNNFTHLFLSSEITCKCLRSLLDLFPNIVQLSIRCHEPSLIPDFAFYLNSLESLTKLHLEGPFHLALPKLSITLSKLDEFSIDIRRLNYGDHHQLISQLGLDCDCVYFRKELTYNQIRQWHIINPLWLGNVTHLEVHIHCTSEEGAKVVHNLCEHATSLVHLKIPFSNPLVLTNTVIRELGKLTNLVELDLWNIYIDFCELEQAVVQQRLTSLCSILTCKLNATIHNDQHQKITASRFTRVFSIILPKLVEFYFDIHNGYARIETVGEYRDEIDGENRDEMDAVYRDEINEEYRNAIEENLYMAVGEEYNHGQEIDELFQVEIEQHLYRFPNLCKHKIFVQ